MPRKPEIIRRQLSVHLAKTCNLYCEYCQAPPDGACQGRAEVAAAEAWN
jgi:molybdenum cofactor biosynthesis enzyme MoaA